jgi:hypothetical protein
MTTAEATFISALALSSPLWLAVIAGKISEHRSRRNHPTNQTKETAQ